MFMHLAQVKSWGFAVAAIMILIAAGYGSLLLASKQELSALVPVVGLTLGFLVSWLLANIPALAKAPVRWLRILPGMDAVLENEKERLEHAALVKDMKQTLEFYKLQCPESYDWKSLEAALGTYGASQELVRHCVAEVSKVCAVEPKTLELLYYERERPVPHDLWPPTTDNPFPGLGEILIRSGHLPNDDLDVTAEDVERLVHPLSDFRLELVVAVLEKLREVWRNAGSYLMFLNRNRLVADETAVNTAAMLNTIASQGDGLPTLPTNLRLIIDATFPVLRNVWEEGIKGHMATDGDELNALFLISVVIFCTRSQRVWPFLPEVFTLLARNPLGTPMVWAYLAVKQDFRRGNWSGARPFLRLDEYYRKWREKYQEREAMPGSSLKSEEDALYDALMDGVWIISREKLMNTVLKIPTVPSAQGEQNTTIPTRATPAPLPSKAPLEMLRSTPGVRRPLQRLFGLLELDTVERYLETKTVTPYVLTLGQSTGPASSLLDCMASQEKTTFLEQAGVEFLGPDEKPNYNFRHYTPYARIGIVPANKSFSDFCKLFKKDFNKLLEYHNDYLGSEDTKTIHRYEILIHAFNPAVDNPFDFGVPAGRRPALQRIKKLFAEVLDNAEMYALIEYEGRFERDVHVKLMDVVMQSTIADLTGAWKDISEVDRHALDTADHSIKEDFLGTLGIAFEQERALVPYLKPGTDKRKQAVEALQQAIMKRVPELKEKEQFCEDLASAYLDEVSASSRGLSELERELGRAHLASRT